MQYSLTNYAFWCASIRIKSSKRFLISIFFPPVEEDTIAPCPTPAWYFVPQTMMTYLFTIL